MNDLDEVPLSAGLIELAVIGWLLWGCAAYGLVLVWRAVGL